MEEQFSLSPKWWGTPYLFNGKELDSRTNLYYYVSELVRDIEMSRERAKRSSYPAAKRGVHAEWYYDPGISGFLSVDRFAEKNPGYSPYQNAANNPITFIGVNGDSIGVNLMNGASKEAFDAFFATKEGRSFIGQYAAKGQTINDHSFKSDGKYHRSGIDLIYSDKDHGKGEESSGANTDGGRDGGTFVNGRLKLNVSINTTAQANSLMDKVIDITHESFLHVQEYSFDFVDNGRLDNSNDSFYQKTKDNSPKRRHHLMFHYKKDAITTILSLQKD